MLISHKGTPTWSSWYWAFFDDQLTSATHAFVGKLACGTTCSPTEHSNLNRACSCFTPPELRVKRPNPYGAFSCPNLQDRCGDIQHLRLCSKLLAWCGVIETWQQRGRLNINTWNSLGWRWRRHDVRIPLQHFVTFKPFADGPVTSQKNMGVSKNRDGPPKSTILIGFPL